MAAENQRTQKLLRQARPPACPAAIILKSLSTLTSRAHTRHRGGGGGDRTFPLGGLRDVVFVVHLARRCGLDGPAYDATRQQKKSPVVAGNIWAGGTSEVGSWKSDCFRSCLKRALPWVRRDCRRVILRADTDKRQIFDLIPGISSRHPPPLLPLPSPT